MSGAPLKIMVDANVWVDSFCVDHAESLAARAFIGQATESGATLFFPVHIAKDVLYVVQHELKRSVLASGERSTGICPCNWRCGVGVCSEHDRKRHGCGCRCVGPLAGRQILSAPSRLRGQLGARRMQARAGRLLGDQRSKTARTCRSCSKDPAPNDADSGFGRTWWRGYRLTRTVCGPLGRRCAKGPASAITKVWP